MLKPFIFSVMVLVNAALCYCQNNVEDKPVKNETMDSASTPKNIPEKKRIKDVWDGKHILKNEIGITGPVLINGLQYNRFIYWNIYIGINLLYFTYNPDQGYTNTDFDIGPILKYKIIDTKRHELYVLTSIAYIVDVRKFERPNDYISKDTEYGYKYCLGIGYAFNFAQHIKASFEVGWQKMEIGGQGQQWWKDSYGNWQTGPGGVQEYGDFPGFAFGVFFEI
jgi:hypothetical protein